MADLQSLQERLEQLKKKQENLSREIANLEMKIQNKQAYESSLERSKAKKALNPPK